MFFRAKLAHFYGWTHHYIEELEYGVALEYYEAITPIEAQGRLADLNVSDYPHMNKDGRKNIFKSINKMAYPDGLRKEVSFEDFGKKLGMMNG